MMRDEGLRAAEDPSEVAAAQLLSSSEREEHAQPGRIGESASSLDRLGERFRIRQFMAHTLGGVQIEAEKVARVVSCHDAILTIV